MWSEILEVLDPFEALLESVLEGNGCCTSMRKCAMCGRPINNKKQMVTIKTGKWFRKKVMYFHLDCFLENKIKARDITIAMVKE